MDLRCIVVIEGIVVLDAIAAVIFVSLSCILVSINNGNNVDWNNFIGDSIVAVIGGTADANSITVDGILYANALAAIFDALGGISGYIILDDLFDFNSTLVSKNVFLTLFFFLLMLVLMYDALI